MRLSTKGHYAVTAMLDLCIQDQSGPVSLLKISNCQGISLSYLEQLFARLRKAGLVRGVRGPGGGYLMARLPGQITIAEIITAVDEKMDATQCGGSQDCQDGKICLTHKLWNSLSDKIYKFLDGITLQEFLERPSTRALIDKRSLPVEEAGLGTLRFVAR